MAKRPFLHPAFFFYFFVLAVELAAQFFSNNALLQTIHPFAKSLLMPLLIYGVAAAAGSKQPHVKFLYAALLLSWFGDMLLLFQNRNLFFMLGLAAFLAAHIFYIMLYAAFTNRKELTAQWLPTLAVWLLALLLLTYLWKSLYTMLLPVIFYAFTISTMVTFALMTKQFILRNAYSFILNGSLLFLLSDSILAVNRFKTPFAAAGFLIMLTYAVAQFLIAKGVVTQLRHSSAVTDHAA